MIVTFSGERDVFRAIERKEMTAQIIPFPQDRSYGAARAVALDVLTKQTQTARQGRFDRALRSLGNRLDRSGLSVDQIDAQLDAFTRLVNSELFQLEARRSRPGGAA